MLNDYDVGPTLPTADLAAAKAFYSGLGFAGQPAGPDEEMGLVFTSGASRFLVYPSQYAGTNKATSMFFEVPPDAFDDMIQGLRGKGITFDTFDMPDGKWEDGVLTGMGMKSVWFHDPDGNIINVGAYEGSAGA